MGFLLPLAAVLLCAGPPLLGARLGGLPLDLLLEFPPRTRFVAHAPFSPWAFALLALFVAGWIAPFARRAWRWRPDPAAAAALAPRRPFPWWGWAGLAWTAAFWALAWTRAEWFAPFQRHTFPPLWLGFIVVVSALAHRRGPCLALRRPGPFLLLFPLSAAFWWLFEFLNRFVQNWRYQWPGEPSAGEYLLWGSLSFATVLPAFAAARDWLMDFRRLQAFASFAPLRLARPRAAAGGAVLLAAAGLAFVGLYPDWLFPLLWLAPVFVLAGLPGLAGRPTVLDGPARGDWRGVAAAALAALLCGFFWELWNYQSLAKWVYEVPRAGALKVFEMPLLGWAGYLPFGLECAAACAFLRGEDWWKTSEATRR